MPKKTKKAAFDFDFSFDFFGGQQVTPQADTLETIIMPAPDYDPAAELLKTAKLKTAICSNHDLHPQKRNIYKYFASEACKERKERESCFG